jgi:hypothetical protein
MNGFTRTPWQFARYRLLWLGPILWGVGLVGSSRVEAARIHHDHDSSLIDPGSYKTWSEYILGGPSVWSSVAHPALSKAIEASMWKSIKNDPPPDTTAVVNYFLYRQGLDAKRFDHYHPNIAKSLAKIEAQLINPSTTPATATSPTDQAQQLTPSTVPEPTTLFLTIGMTGYAMWWRRRRV